ncbi:MAG: VCBS repeat-containing protein [Planctomycetota bacterium]
MIRLGPLAIAAVLALAPTARAQSPFPASPVWIASESCVDTLNAAELDGDGDSDVLLGSSSTRRLSWLENRGGGSFGPLRVVAQNLDVRDVQPVDLDGDGALDVLVAARANGGIFWVRNLGGLAFAAPAAISTALPGARSVRATDLDGDGDSDIVVAAESGDTVAWVENLGAGAFGAPRPIDSTIDRPTCVAVGDLDGDGDVDIVAGAHNADLVAWYENLGAGVFGPRQVVAQLTMNFPEVSVVDYDGDGVEDIVFTPIGCCLAGCRGIGAGAFAPSVLLTMTYFCGDPTPFEVADHDLDGHVDVLLSVFRTYVDWAQGLGSGAFSPSYAVLTDLQACSSIDRKAVVSLDHDGDGDRDVITLSGPSSVVLFENNTVAFTDCNGNGVHDPNEITAGTAADLDGDGVLDACEELGVRYCTPAVPNSTGSPAEIVVLGSDVVADDDVVLAARGLPPQSVGYFLTSLTSGSVFPVSNSQGVFCLSGAIGRFRGPGQLVQANAGGTVALPIALGQLPTPTGPVPAVANSTWNFTLWHRDANPAGTSNFADAISVTFH